MSDHAVEDFIENCVRLAAAADMPAQEKRRLFYHLYRLQNHFDCSHTVLRCFPELAQYGFIRKLPLAQHPDFRRHPSYFSTHADNEWLAADVGHPDGETVFSLIENGERWVFPQFGSRMWTRLCSDGLIDESCEPPVEMPLPDLILRIVQLAHAARNDILMKEAYLLFVECWRAHIFWNETPLPHHFDDWLGNPTLTELREWAVAHNLLNIRRKDSALRRYSLTEELDYADTPDDEAVIRLLLDLKKNARGHRQQTGKNTHRTTKNHRKSDANRTVSRTTHESQRLASRHRHARRSKKNLRRAVVSRPCRPAAHFVGSIVGLPLQTA